MKPRNPLQRRIVELSATLPPLTGKQRRWAIDHCFSRKAFLSKGKAWCSCCGTPFDASGISPLGAILTSETVVCPSCGKTLKVESSRRLKHSEKWYYTILTTCHGFQVCRNFTVSKDIRRGEKPWYDITEVVQNWITEDGREEVIARPINAIAGYYDNWAHSKPMELRDSKRPDMYRPDKYRIGGAWIYPVRKVLPLARRNGYTGLNRTGLPESDHIRLLLADREAEWLEKTGQYELLRWKHNHGLGEFRMPCAHAIRIANRNRYHIRDASLWIDYLELLDYFHLDTHNPRYVCPKNLRAEHDRLSRLRERKEAKEEAERKLRQAAQWEADYRALKGAYLGICFGNDAIRITVLQSVAEFAEEGRAMHHCVYSANYFKKPEALILSAKSPDGKRLATIELNLRTFKVVQCRGVCNKQPEYYDEIIKNVTDNMWRIRETAETLRRTAI
ncbi:MAG: PcfJ domain-containing protein, partial [Muribaculaceae bacterium]|nr:PcfJ domain-containing protein [Muribaculaceae bacterium]